MVKLPAFLAWAAWVAARGLELPLAQPEMAMSVAEREAARIGEQRVESERLFIFMATEEYLGLVRDSIRDWIANGAHSGLTAERWCFRTTEFCITGGVRWGMGV